MTRHVPALGATVDANGTTFAVYSENADAIHVCLVDDDAVEHPHELNERHGAIHYRHIPGVRPGQRYGIRVEGPWAPQRGVWANPAKFLIDPAAQAVHGDIRWDDAVYGSLLDERTTPSTVDSAPFMPHGVVVDHDFDWTGDVAPNVPWSETVIYETHVKSLTRLHPDVPPEHRGTYLGLAAPAVIEHLVNLGVTTVELMPVQHFTHDHRLERIGLRNLWGYQPIAWQAPHYGYASSTEPGAQVDEFKTAVRALHAAGIEVILDVVFNHTGEGDHRGAHLSMRGIDNPTYYRLDDRDASRYLDYTGTGNTVNADHPAVIRLVADSLRRWVTDYHIDGFRFDLATTLGRHRNDFDPVGPFFQVISQDPVLNSAKLIAEPWDIGPDGYRLGGYPHPWREWNDRYRSTIRDLWRPTNQPVADVATRLAGSSDVFGVGGRRAATSSINYVVSHDGFTLQDLVSYDQRHNDANGENGNDGHPDNRSWNGGVEGPTDDPAIVELRDRRRRSLLATLFVSQGVPMIAGGDELGRTQRGNNNAYAQDADLSWYHWDTADPGFLGFVQRLSELRRTHPALRQRHWLTGTSPIGSPREDVAWLTAGGTEMTPDQWNDPSVVTLMVHLNGAAVSNGPGQGAASLLILLNGGNSDQVFIIPNELAQTWHPVVDTEQPMAPEATTHGPGDSITVAAYGLVVLTEDAEAGA